MLKNRSKEINVNDPDFLNLAVQQNNKELVRWLLEKGCNINAQDEMQRSPIHWATIFGNKDMVEFLLQNGADINLRTKHDYTLIHLAIWYGKLHLVEVFAQNGANVDQMLPDGTIASHVVLRWAINGNKRETVLILLENGTKINCRDGAGFTLLHHSIMEGNERM